MIPHTFLGDFLSHNRGQILGRSKVATTATIGIGTRNMEAYNKSPLRNLADA